MLNGNAVAILTVTTVFLAISLVTVFLRLYVRQRLIRAFGWDDGFMAAAMIFGVTFAICTIFGAIWGFGKKDTDFQEPSYFRRAMLAWFLGQVFYSLTCMTAQLSVCTTILRVAVDKVYSAVLYAAMALSVIAGLVLFFITILQCQPTRYFWDGLHTSKCIDIEIIMDIMYFYSVSAAVTDFTVGILPFFLIWKLRMRFRSKVALASILGAACIASAAVIARIPFLRLIVNKDFLYVTTPISICSNIEASLLITAGSCTTLRPLVRVFHGSTRGRNQEELQSTASTPSKAMGLGDLRDINISEGFCCSVDSNGDAVTQ